MNPHRRLHHTVRTIHKISAKSIVKIQFIPHTTSITHITYLPLFTLLPPFTQSLQQLHHTRHETHSAPNTAYPQSPPITACTPLHHTQLTSQTYNIIYSLHHPTLIIKHSATILQVYSDHSLFYQYFLSFFSNYVLIVFLSTRFILWTLYVF